MSRTASATTRPGAPGRVTFNPLKHVDPFGTILLPAMLILLRSPFLFGYAKPVPVNFGASATSRGATWCWVALAGPGTNVLLAIVSSLLFYGVGLVPPSPAEWLAENLIAFDPDQRGAVRLQHAAVAAVGRRPGRGRVAAAIRWLSRWRGSSRYGMLIL